MRCSGFCSFPSTKSLLAGHTFAEKLGHAVGCASAHLLAFSGAGFLEKGVPRVQVIQFILGDRGFDVSPRRDRRPLLSHRFKLEPAIHSPAFRRRAQPETSPESPSNPLRESRPDSVFPRAAGRRKDGIERDA